MINIFQKYKHLGLNEADIEYLYKLANHNEKIFQRYAQRRLLGEPLTYIMGSTIFFGRQFEIDKRVYIPNRETQYMVGTLLQYIGLNSTVVDIGTGSGTIAITIKKEFPMCKIYAVDIDPGALDVARINARKHEVDICFSEGFYVDELDLESVDFIISDLPYGSPKYALQSINVKEFEFMPPTATFHPKGILEAYRELIASIQKKKWHCKLFIETGLVPEDEVKKIIPTDLNWHYKKLENYSVTIVEF